VSDVLSTTTTPTVRATPLALRARLVLLAFLMLFIELALIRWLGANVLYLAYFSNIVLLGSFLGIGLGFLRASRTTTPLLPWAPLALAALLVATKLLSPKVGITGGTLIFLGLDTSGPPRWIVLPAIFVCVAAVLACIGDGVARTFQQLKNLDAYNLDLIGSLLGSAGFALLSFLNGVPLVWGIITSVGLFVVINPRTRAALALTIIPLAVLLGVLGAESFEDNVVWTPYYKTEAEPINGDAAANGYVARVNGIPTWFQLQSKDNDTYESSYRRMATDDPGDVLIIGAGSGNDTSLAIENGASHIDAVEIDERLLELGRSHPDRPYDNPIVDTHINDGRAYIERSDKDWDTILLALPDSLTLLQGNSSVRLESFLFTEEAAEAYRDHLADGGVFSMYNYYREPWLVDRYAGTLEEVFGNAPCIDTLRSTLSILTVSVDPTAVDCPPDHVWQRGDNVPPPATDDRPFPYLRTRTIPTFYLASIAIILVVAIAGVRIFGGPFRDMRGYLDLFFLGVAFLLLETKHVVQFALLFGTTWLVNALVFIGVLLSVLCAVMLSKRVRIERTGLLYLFLLASVVLAWVVPGSALLDLAPIPRFLAAATLAFLPIFTANLVFAQRFRDTADSTSAFGANLLGAMVGGLLEYTSLVFGYRNLLILVAVLYGLAFLSGRRALAASG
jgi:hypothetical protein